MQIQSGWINGKKSLENWSVLLYNFCWKIPHCSHLMKTGSSIHKYKILCLWYIIILIRKWVLDIHVQRGKKGDSFPKMFPIFFWIRISKSRRLTCSVCVHYSLLHTAFCNLFQSFHYKQKNTASVNPLYSELIKSNIEQPKLQHKTSTYTCIRFAIKGSVTVKIQINYLKNYTKWIQFLKK